MKYTLLIADDEPDIVNMLKSYFCKRGYEILTALNGNDALKMAQRQPDLILLDISMPDLDGLEVCKRIRKLVSCPILFVTARIEDTDKIKGFAAGGDDYILKPFSMAPLEARISAHLRREERRGSETKTRVRFSGELSIDYSQRLIIIGETQLQLAKKEFDIVELLSQNAGQIFDREGIYERIWGYDSTGDSSVVAEHIRRIRAKLTPFTSRSYIETVWGCGYKWIK